MSNFACEKCGTAILDSDKGYTTFCKHYPPEPTFHYVYGVVHEKMYYRYYKDAQGLGIECCTKTRRKDGLPVGKGKTTYFYVPDKKEFKGLKELIDYIVSKQ